MKYLLIAKFQGAEIAAYVVEDYFAGVRLMRDNLRHYGNDIRIISVTM